MPELPETENIARALKQAVCGRTICGVEVYSPRLRTSLLPLKDAKLVGHKIIDVLRRGRYVLAKLDDNRALMLHFGMSGVIRVEAPDEPPRRKHEHVFVFLDDGRAMRFEDPRRFGLFECVALNADGLPQCLESLGVEPLTPQFDAQYLHDAAHKHQMPVKLLLMDNTIVTGIGNIYANETLFAAGIAPQRSANTLTLDECAHVVREAKAILLRAIAAGGSTISDFRNVDGSEGKFARELLIYGKKSAPCPKCGAQIECITLGGRSSFYCPHCQQ